MANEIANISSIAPQYRHLARLIDNANIINSTVFSNNNYGYKKDSVLQECEFSLLKELKTELDYPNPGAQEIIYGKVQERYNAPTPLLDDTLTGNTQRIINQKAEYMYRYGSTDTSTRVFRDLYKDNLEDLDEFGQQVLKEITGEVKPKEAEYDKQISELTKKIKFREGSLPGGWYSLKSLLTRKECKDPKNVIMQQEIDEIRRQKEAYVNLKNSYIRQKVIQYLQENTMKKTLIN